MGCLLSDSLPKAEQHNKSRHQREEGQRVARRVQHPEAHHQLFHPQLGRQIPSRHFWEVGPHTVTSFY